MVFDMIFSDNLTKMCTFKGVSRCAFSKLKSVNETHLCQVEASRLSR